MKFDSANIFLQEIKYVWEYLCQIMFLGRLNHKESCWICCADNFNVQVTYVFLAFMWFITGNISVKKSLCTAQQTYVSVSIFD